MTYLASLEITQNNSQNYRAVETIFSKKSIEKNCQAQVIHNHEKPEGFLIKRVEKEIHCFLEKIKNYYYILISVDPLHFKSYKVRIIGCTFQRGTEMSELGFYNIANNAPDEIALIDPSEKAWTRGELLSKANKLTHALRHLGLKPGDSVALVLPNSAEYFISYLACAQAGFYIVPINWHLTGIEIAYILTDSGAKAFIASGANLHLKEACIQAKRESGFSDNACIASDEIEGFIQLESFINRHPDLNPENRTAGQVMNYTSGTTGKPKGVKRALISGDPDEILTMFAMIYSLYKIQPFDSNVHLVGSPMYHTAIIVHSTAALHYGHCLVVMDKFDAEKMLYLIDKYKVTSSHMVPTQFHRLLKLPEDVKNNYSHDSLTTMIHAAAPCPVHTKQAMIAWWGDVIWEYYAATEGGGTVVSSESWKKFPGTVGQAWPGAELKILDDDHLEVPTETQGTVYMKLRDGTDFEYKDALEKTKKDRLEIDGSVFFTVGDVGYLNKDKYLFLCDRKIDMIISGGTNIYPAEIESIFLMHPLVADVAVFGIPNEEWGEEIKSVIELVSGTVPSETTKDELMSFAKENMAKMKLPKSIDLMEQLPRDENGKLYKRKLRDPYWENHQTKV